MGSFRGEWRLQTTWMEAPNGTKGGYKFLHRYSLSLSSGLGWIKPMGSRGCLTSSRKRASSSGRSQLYDLAGPTLWLSALKWPTSRHQTIEVVPARIFMRNANKHADAEWQVFDSIQRNSKKHVPIYHRCVETSIHKGFQPRYMFVQHIP